MTEAFAPGAGRARRVRLPRPRRRAALDARADHRRRGGDDGAAHRPLRPPREPAAARGDRRHARRPGARRAGDRLGARERPRRHAARAGVRPRRGRHLRDRRRRRLGRPDDVRRPGVHEVGVRASDAGFAVSRQTVLVGLPPLVLSLPDGPGPAGRAGDLPRERAGDVGARAGPARRSRTRSPRRAPTRSARVRATAGVAMRTVTVEADTGLPPAVTSFTLPAAITAGRPARIARDRRRPGRRTAARSHYDLDGDGAFDDPLDGGRWTFPQAGPLTVAVRATDVTGASATRSAEIAPASANLPPDVVFLPGELTAGVAGDAARDGQRSRGRTGDVRVGHGRRRRVRRPGHVHPGAGHDRRRRPRDR